MITAIILSLAFFAFLGLAIALSVTFAIRRGRRGKWEKRSWDLPELGIQRHVPEVDRDLREMIRRMERALPEGYVDRLKRRVMEKGGIGEEEWGNRWFELKRFFVLTAILKSVPMYSRDVDDVWHEMLLFTRDYERFSREFLGTYLHHNPHDQPVFDPAERAWFDWIYTLLFRPTPYSRHVWGPFFRHPLPRDLLTEFETSSEDELLKRHFNLESAARYEDAKRLCHFVIGTVRRAISEARQYERQHGRDIKSLRVHMLSRQNRETEPAVWMLGAMAYLSLYHYHDYLAVQGELLKRAADSGSGTGYAHGGSYCAGVWGGLDSGSDSGGADGGSGCGAGCGGAGCGGGS